MSTTFTPETTPAPEKLTHSRSAVPINLTHDVERVADTLAIAFKDSASNEYLMKKFFNVPIDEYVSPIRMKTMIQYFTAFYDDKGADIVEANDFHAVAIYTRPNEPISQWLTNDDKFNKELFFDLDHKKHEIFPEGHKYYYLFIIGKDLSKPEIRGSVRKIFETYKEKADAENASVVLEAISEKAKAVYEYFGFKTYLNFNYGKNEVDKNGKPDPNGEGFDAYLMFYNKNTFPGYV
ncbi:uncharacterized protein SCODWIG_03323 [Saccharomycodes ludwigii]|uniref:N-acetyltransferase domain-containing protein n=1 Tax=Saccharomycodes ludwigii TaxID=36035 RepID=A0A376BA76_9ASCO|nr:hypothetical protein SCDLUD_000247 [Saccharomycodes ludwigii]KAH3902664.1 hypothetical protein SCDLUD_000247 [Saccharomycodes ludwigii]SSD61562.1 uncharacterized protein SCODWIG_03323 [Saccharomycodes ludwigii]